MSEVLNEKIAEFKLDLSLLDSKQIVRKYITYGNTYVIAESKYFELKDLVSEYFDIHPSQVIIVGSGKLGFSISENKVKDPPKLRYRYFGDDSDIDVAIISEKLFDKIWEEVYDYYGEKGFWYSMPAFSKYLFQGWIRPDKLPPSKKFKVANDWWDFFQMITNSDKFGSYKISAGLYKSWYFLENYQMTAVNQCKNI